MILRLAALAHPSTSLGMTLSLSKGQGRRAGRIALITAAVLFGGSSTVFACPMCFGAQESSLIDGAKLGILVLLGITLAVQGAFVGFFFYLRKQAKRVSDADLDVEWSQLQKGGSRTS
jgi:heme/copper-type cytochrome/quinol oxidase subunit 2